MVFKPGQSGNPKGRTPNREYLIDKFKKRGLIDKAIAVLEEGLKGSYRVDCAKYIIDHSVGKPAQSVDMKVQGKILVVDE